jgi:GR25 family glycosyltransferase involved in LPS biosynthesis
MRTFCIYCQELPTEKDTAEKHFKLRGLDVDFVNGIHAESFGLLPSRPYNKGYLTPISQVGLCLSHYLVWTICAHTPGDTFMVLEADSKFPMDWQARLDVAMSDLPADWDIFLIGNSHTSDKKKKHICGDVWEVKYPFCTNAYILKKKCLPVLLETCREATYNIDLVLIERAYPLLHVFTCLPRLCDQRGMDLPV